VAEGPTYEVSRLGHGVEIGGRPLPGFGQVPYLDVAATLDEAQQTATFFVLNRDLEKARELAVSWHDLTPRKVNSCLALTGNDLKATNTFAAPKQVIPQTLETPKVGSKMLLEIPARCYTLLNLSLA